MEEQPARSYPAGRTKVWASAFRGVLSFPPAHVSPMQVCKCMHVHTHTRTHTALWFPVLSGRNRDGHLVRGPLWKQQGGVQAILRCQGWYLWHVFIRGYVLGDSSHQVVQREGSLKNSFVKDFQWDVEVSKLFVYSFPIRNACFILKLNHKLWFYREKHRISEEIKLLRQRQERIDKELDRFVSYSTL